MKRNKLLLIIAFIPILLIPLTGLTWIIFSIYCLLIYFKKTSDWYSKIPINPKMKFFLFALIFGLITEIFAILDNIPKPPSQRILLNPDPFVDIYLAIGFYSAFALLWMLAISFFNFNHRAIFLIGGAFGILFEQTGAILLSFNFFAYLYVFLVYGSYQASAAVLADGEMKKFERRSLKYWQMVLMGAGVEITAFLLAGLFLFLLNIPLSQ